MVDLFILCLEQSCVLLRVDAWVRGMADERIQFRDRHEHVHAALVVSKTVFAVFWIRFQ
jgi:hypothetical protein